MLQYTSNDYLDIHVVRNRQSLVAIYLGEEAFIVDMKVKRLLCSLFADRFKLFDSDGARCICSLSLCAKRLGEKTADQITYNTDGDLV